MSHHSNCQSEPNASDTFSTKCGSITPLNHLFGPDGILLGITVSKATYELANFRNASSYIHCDDGFDPKSACTIS